MSGELTADERAAFRLAVEAAARVVERLAVRVTDLEAEVDRLTARVAELEKVTGAAGGLQKVVYRCPECKTEFGGINAPGLIACNGCGHTWDAG